jgi:cytidylate kinase
LGSGKSTVSRLLCAQLGYDYVYTGAIQRTIADRLGMTTTELNLYSETHPEIDAEIDAVFKSLGSSSNLIIDSRLAWFFVPDSFKVYIKTNIMVSAERIAKDSERKSEHYETTVEAACAIITRKKSENRRYVELYGADCANPSNFNLVIDASFLSPESLASIIISEFTAETVSSALLSPRNLYPIQPPCNYSDSRRNYLNAHIRTYGFDSIHRPVSVVDIDGVNYIVNGHKRVSAALMNNIALIPVDWVSPSFIDNKGLITRDKVRTAITPSIFSAWEKAHDFQYLFYPEFG